MDNSNTSGLDAALKELQRSVADPRAKRALSRLRWVLCVAFYDTETAETAFERAFTGLLDAESQKVRRLEASMAILERVYDIWLAAVVTDAEEPRAGDRRPRAGSTPAPCETAGGGALRGPGVAAVVGSVELEGPDSSSGTEAARAA